MAIVNFEEYIQELKTKIAKLRQQVNDNDKLPENEKSKYLQEVERLKEEVKNDLRDYAPDGLSNLSINQNISLRLTEEDILRALAELYKLV